MKDDDNDIKLGGYIMTYIWYKYKYLLYIFKYIISMEVSGLRPGDSHFWYVLGRNLLIWSCA